MLTGLDPSAQNSGRVLEVFTLVNEQHLDIRVRSQRACGRQARKASA